MYAALARYVAPSVAKAQAARLAAGAVITDGSLLAAAGASHFIAAADAGDTPLDTRIERLQAAIAAAERPRSEVGVVAVPRDEVELWKSTLRVLQLQQQLLHELTRRRDHIARHGAVDEGDAADRLDALADVIAALQQQGMLSVATLYNEVAVPFELHDVALAILNVSGRASDETVFRHWMAVLQDTLQRVHNGMYVSASMPLLDRGAGGGATALREVIGRIGRALITDPFGGAGMSGSNILAVTTSVPAVFQLQPLLELVELRIAHEQAWPRHDPHYDFGVYARAMPHHFCRTGAPSTRLASRRSQPAGWFAVRTLDEAGLPLAPRYIAYTATLDKLQ